MFSFFNPYKRLLTTAACTAFLFLSFQGAAQCPEVEAMMIDACGTEQLNEFVIVNSGSAGFNTNDIIVDFAMGNNAFDPMNNDINTDVDNSPPGTPCGLTMGNIANYTGCSNLIAIGPGFNVPPNQIVVIQMSSGSTNGLYNFASLCGMGECVYVISNSCTRERGAFTNSGTGTRTTNFEFGGGCMQSVTYDFANFTAANGAYYLPLTDTYGNNGCVAPPSSPAPDPQTPEFDIEDEYCIGDTPDALPNTSDNGITGSWSPAVINTSSPGSADYVFTPNAGQCAEPFTLTVTVSLNVVPVFLVNLDYCLNETPDILPTTSNNGVTGSWNPAVINTSSPGQTNYIFTPDPGQCADIIDMVVTVDALVVPDFTVDDTYCVGETPDILPNTSDNGITGTWNPAVINTSSPGVTNYTFTPSANQCAEIVTIAVTVSANVNPIFTIDNQYCVGDTPDNLPDVSNNGITGSWNPATINTSSAGSTAYTFTPDAGQCANTFIFSVIVNNNVTPTFAPIGDICEGGTPPALPSSSLNGVSGTWNPAVINTSTPGTFSFTFTPNAGQCAVPVTIDITILEVPRGYIEGNVNICPGQCGEVSFNLSGGSGLYTLNMQISVGAFNIPFTVPGATFSTVLEICYTGTGFLPSFQPPATLILPQSAPPGTATLTLLSITDGNGGPCPGGIITNNTMSLTLRPPAEAFNAQLSVCDEDNDGTGIFDLTEAEGDVTGNDPNATVTWYTDSGLTDQISNPSAFSATDGTIVYALVEDEFGCTDVAQVTLLLEEPETPVLPTFTVCLTDPPLPLPTSIGGVTGNWSDAGGHVTANQFDPSGLAEGNYTITFTPDPGQCFIAANTTVTVTSGGPIPLDGIPAIVCVGLNTLTLPDMPNNVMGNWSSPSSFLSGNIFNVAGAGPGIYDFTFTPDDPNSCFLPNTIQVEVTANAVLTAPDLGDICENSGLFNLPATVSGVSGTWGNSPFVSNNQFNTNAGAGDYTITFFPDDECTDDLDMTITIDPATNLTPVTFSPLCPSSPIVNLPLTVQGVPGVWTLNSVIVTTFNPQTSGNGSFELVFTPLPGSCAAGFTSVITVGSVNAGQDRIDNICVFPNSQVNLLNYLSPSANPGGAWAVDGNPLADPTMVDLTVLSEGNHVFTYILSDPVCGNDTAFFTFTLQQPKTAGNDGLITLCQPDRNAVNFTAVLGSFSPGGTWTNSRNLPIDFSNPAQTDLGSVPSGNTVFTYRFDAAICPGDTAVITVTIDSLLTAGPDRTGNICINSVTDLNNLIGSTFQGGTWQDVNGYGGLTGSTWEATGKTEGNYTFLYLRGPNGACPADTAQVLVSVQANISAGEDVTGEYCDGQGFIASDFLPASASPGGKLFNGPFEVPFGMQILSNLPQYQLLYITGDGITCPFDTARWTIRRVDRPNVSFIVNNLAICAGDCGDLILRHNSNEIRQINARITNSQVFNRPFTLIPNQNVVINFCVRPTDPLSFSNLELSGSNIFTIETITSGQCEFVLNPKPSATFVVKAPVTQTINRTLCKGQRLTIGNRVFDENNPAGNVVVPGTGNDCDTTFSVMLTFRPDARGSFIRETCDANFLVTIGNQTFNQSNRTGTVTLPGASSFGCDSIVDVALTFLMPARNNITERSCDPAFTVTIANTTFDRNKPSGQVVLNGQAANGCDSIVSVNLIFLSPSTVNVDTTVCDPAFTLNIGNTTFDQNNPAGQVVLAGSAANGCDSIINVSLTFENFLVGENIELPACGENSGSLFFQTADPNGPFVLLINGIRQPDIPVLPYEQDFAPGTYQVDIFSPAGCTRTFSFEIPDNSLPQITIDSVNTGNDVYNFTLQGDTDRLYDISWSPASIFSCTDCISTVATPLQDTEVVLTYSFGEDCLETLRFSIRKSVAGEFEIPNAIKPGSGGNGTFYITAPENFNGIITSMAIYDRWGEKVFSGENLNLGDPNAGWNGSFSNRDVIPGVYVYVVEILDFSGNQKIVFQGDITVVR